jgi:ParB family chromosome partitioning protein
VLAVIAEAMTDSSLFLEMERENRQRADLSPYEQGLMYRRAIDDKLFKTNTELASAIGENLANLGKKLALAELPREVIEAFPSPLKIQLRWGGILKKAHEIDQDGLLKRAKAIKKEGASLKPAEVLEALLGNGSAGGSSELPPVKVNLSRREDGGATIDLPAGALTAEREQELAKLIADFLAKR